MMKRNIIKKLGLKNKKWGLGLILAGMAALNVGFTNQVTAIENSEVAQVAGAIPDEPHHLQHA